MNVGYWHIYKQVTTWQNEWINIWVSPCCATFTFVDLHSDLQLLIVFFTAHPIEKCFIKTKKVNTDFGLSKRHENRHFSRPPRSFLVWSSVVWSLNGRFGPTVFLQQVWEILKLHWCVQKLPQTQQNVQNDSESTRIPHLGKWGEWIVHPTSQKSQPVFPLLTPIYLSTKSRKSRLPISSPASHCCVEVQAVSLLCLDTCSGPLTGPPGPIPPSLILYMVARGLSKIPTHCVPPRLKPFWGFPLPLRLLNMPGLVCPRLLLWPHLPPHLCMLISTSTSERLCLGSFVTWGASHSECCQPCFSHRPIAWRTVFIFMLGWSTYSQGRLLWSSQTWSGPPLTCHGL